MAYIPGDSLSLQFTIQNPTTGAATDADSLPTAVLSRNGTDDGAVTLTVTNKATGRYEITGTIPSGYAEADTIAVRVSATVGGIAGNSILLNVKLDARRTGALLTSAGYTAPNNAGIATTVSGISALQDSFDALPTLGSGPYTVTIDAGTPGAAVSLSAGNDVLKGTTGDDGTLELYPADLGAHALKVTKEGYDPISRTEPDLTDDGTISAVLQAIVVPQPSDPSLATVIFRAIDFGVAAPDIRVTFTPVAKGSFAIDGGYETDHTITVVTDENGQAEADLYPASVLTANGITPPQYVMSVQQCANLRKTIEVPDGGGLAYQMVVAT